MTPHEGRHSHQCSNALLFALGGAPTQSVYGITGTSLFSEGDVVSSLGLSCTVDDGMGWVSDIPVAAFVRRTLHMSEEKLYGWSCVVVVSKGVLPCTLCGGERRERCCVQLRSVQVVAVQAETG